MKKLIATLIAGAILCPAAQSQVNLQALVSNCHTVTLTWSKPTADARSDLYEVAWLERQAGPGVWASYRRAVVATGAVDFTGLPVGTYRATVSPDVHETIYQDPARQRPDAPRPVVFTIADCAPPGQERASGSEAVTGIELFPNPAAETVNLKLPGDFLAGNPLLELVDLTGKKVYASAVTAALTTVDVSRFPTGVYTAVVRSGEKAIFRSSLVVQR